jgi:hypothetical protein
MMSSVDGLFFKGSTLTYRTETGFRSILRPVFLIVPCGRTGILVPLKVHELDLQRQKRPKMLLRVQTMDRQRHFGEGVGGVGEGPWLSDAVKNENKCLSLAIKCVTL